MGGEAGNADCVRKYIDPDLYEWLVNFVRWRGNGIMEEGSRDAEDLAHDVLLAALENAGAFRGNDSRAFRAWLATIARNEINDSIRAVHKQEETLARRVPLDDVPVERLGCRNDADPIATAEARCVMRRILDRLRGTDAIVLFLHHIDECDVREIAEVFAMSEPAVYKRLRKARKFVGEWLETHPEDLDALSPGDPPKTFAPRPPRLARPRCPGSGRAV